MRPDEECHGQRDGRGRGDGECDSQYLHWMPRSIANAGSRPTRPGGPGRLVLLLGVSQLICWGISYYLIGVFGQPMADELGWTLPRIYAGYSVARGVWSCRSKPFAGATDKDSPRQWYGSTDEALPKALRCG